MFEDADVDVRALSACAQPTRPGSQSRLCMDILVRDSVVNSWTGFAVAAVVGVALVGVSSGALGAGGWERAWHGMGMDREVDAFVSRRGQR